MNLKVRFDILIKNKHKSKLQFALILGLLLVSLVVLWQMIHLWIFVVAILVIINLSAFISYQKDLAVPLIESCLAKEYLRIKAKFKTPQLHLKVVGRIIKRLEKLYQNFLTYLLILFLDSQKSFELFAEGDSSFGIKFDSNKQTLKIKTGEADIKKYSAKELFDFYKSNLAGKPAVSASDLYTLFLQAQQDKQISRAEKVGKSQVKSPTIGEFFDLYQLKKRKLVVFSMSASAGIILSIILLVFIIPSLHRLNASTYGWIQTDWSTGISTTSVAVHPGDKINWAKFFSASANLLFGLTLRPDSIASSTTDTLDADWQTNSSSNAYILDGNIIMLKPRDATCATSTECASNYCGSGTCFNCGVDTVQYEGGPYNADGTSTSTTGYYRTVLIGTQCWLKDNLNVGTMIGSQLAGTTTPQNQTNNSVIEKYCYTYVTQDNAGQITTGTADCAIYGAFYQWPEAVQYNNDVTLTTGTTTAGNIQGICPTGWHIPSDTEYSALSTYLGGDATAGGAMKATGTTRWFSPNTGATNSSGFTALGAGYRNTSGSFTNRGYYAYFWSTLPNGSTYAWNRGLNYGDATLDRISFNRAYGFSVRCLKGL